MKHNLKSYVSLMLAMLLLVCNIPMQAYATENTNLPNATVEAVQPNPLLAGNYKVWNGSLSEGKTDLPLQVALNFKANDTLEEALAGGYADWLCDFYLTFDGMETETVSGAGSYLAGYYGDFGWIAIPTDTVTVERGVEYPIVSQYDATLNYKDICKSVKDFTAALYINPETLAANPNMSVTLKLRMTNPDDETDSVIIGDPFVYTAAELSGKKWPDATVESVQPNKLIAGSYSVWDGSLKESTIDRPLQVALNFKANDTLEEAIAGGYSEWLCDFYLTFDGMETETVSGAGSYLAGYYGNFGWIAIPTDTVTVERGVEYPIVSQYDATLNYKDICKSVKDFTAALYINPETLLANPNMSVTLKLKMTNPDNKNDSVIIGTPYIYTANDLLAANGYVARNTTTKKLYSDVNLANLEAADGETVILLADVKDVKILSVLETLDLNGHTLEAEYVTSFGHIVDNNDANAGMLKVPTNKFLLQSDNAQLPVHTAEGYQFVEVRGFNKAYLDTKQYVFQPLFEDYAHGLLLAGAETSGVNIQVNVSWKTQEGALRSQNFIYNDSFVKDYIRSYKPATKKYGQMFTLKLGETPMDLTYQAQVAFENKVSIKSDSTFVESTGGSTEEDTKDNTTTEKITINTNAGDNQASAVVSQGTKLEGSATADSLKLTVSELADSQGNITLGENEVQKSVDVHIEGISKDNTVPMLITVAEFAEKGLNEGNLKLYHVEKGETAQMTQVFALAEVDAHNEFYYDPATGDITMALATFSEVAVVTNITAAWKGNFDYTWYDASKTELTIANADQLAAFGAIVGGMNGQTQDSFKDKTVKLLADVNLGDKNNANESLIFHPIGYYYKDGDSTVKSFEGTFDGNGHKIANFYQNTWEIKGDYDGNYYKDAMGLFGYVVNGTVKNLTVDNFSSDGEFTPTGVIAAYAVNSTFENIALTNCNPRVYNTGNGGIVGIGGNSDDPDTYKLTFTNITIDNTNKISALWGSWDVACGGLVGMFRGAGHAYMTNCHVAAQIDVFNDVCGNYQYYWYRYAGMMIGTNKNMITDKDGYTVPETSKFHAENCTVHFGEWNDYYYCELVANSLASYTHDHQFSRLEQVDEFPTSVEGTQNFVKVTKDQDGNVTKVECCHFKDGKIWEHEDAGEETVDGKTVLKEDKQCVYLPFNQLFTGYGWGVKHIPVYNGEGYAFEGITILDREVADSVEKFAKADTAKESYTTGTTVTIGELFKAVAIADEKITIKGDKVQVTVSPIDNSGVSGTYEANEDDWTQGTLTLSGTGDAKITIQDYYFCTPTTINITVTGREFIYRVGNQNSVSLDSLLKLADLSKPENVIPTVSFQTVEGATAKGEINGDINFSGIGPINVNITINGKTTELPLEVVDAVNATTATSATKNNVVLLKDCGFSSLEVSGGYTLYGNGFTMTCGSDSAALDTGYSFVTLNNGTLDNVQIVCPNFDYAVLYKSNMTEAGNRSETTDRTRYYNVKSGVMASGNSQILNSRISGARAAVNVTGGNLLIDSSRIELGAVASLLVGSANSVILRDVTLVQKPTASTHDSSKTLMGFSTLFICDENGNAAPVTLEGTLVQNAWIDEKDKQYVPSAGQSIISTVLGKTEYLHDLDGDGTKESLNLGFAYMPESLSSKVNTTTITDNRTNKDTVPYDYAEVSILSGKTYVYSYKNSNGTADSYKTESAYVPNKYGDIIAVIYSDTTDGLESSKSFGTDGWVYELNVDLDKASGYKLDFSKLSMTVNGVAVTDYKVNGSAKPTSPVAVTAGGVTYTLTATIDGKEYTATYKVTGTETSKESPSKISGPTTAGFGVAKSYGGDWSGAADVLTGVKINYWSVAENKYKEYDFSNFTVPGNAGKLNGTNNYWEYTHTNNDFTLKVTNTAAIHSGKSVYGMPIRGTDGKLYFTISSTNGYVGSGTTSRSVTMQYEFTDNNGGEKLTFTHTFNISYSKDEQYSYSDLSGSGKLTKLSGGSGNNSGGCVTPDTLITLADGSRKMVKDLTGTEELLVWNLETGAYDKANIVFVDSDAESNYEIVHLYFADGSDVEVIYEHGFFDYDLGKYVYLDASNAKDYIGHKFVKQADIASNTWETVQLTNVVIENKVTMAYSPVTFEHLCYYTNGILSMPGGIEGLFNIFEVDTKTMSYDPYKMAQDIKKYGLFTYADFAGIIPEIAYEAFNGDILKVAIGKELIRWEDIEQLAERYVPLIPTEEE